MMDCPPPKPTSRSTTGPEPSSCARMWSGPDCGSLATHRILFCREGRGGEAKGYPKTTPTTAPPSPSACRNDEPSPLNPLRAHGGSGPVWTLLAQSTAGSFGDTAGGSGETAGGSGAGSRTGFAVQLQSAATSSARAKVLEATFPPIPARHQCVFPPACGVHLIRSGLVRTVRARGRRPPTRRWAHAPQPDPSWGKHGPARGNLRSAEVDRRRTRPRKCPMKERYPASGLRHWITATIMIRRVRL